MTYCSKPFLSACFFLLFLLIACKEPKHPPAHSAANDTAQAAMDSRSRLIQALKEVRRLIETKDSQQIALIFKFPIADIYFSLSGDSIFEGEKAKNGDQITRGLFLSKYGQFVQELQFDELDSSCRNLDVNKLKTTDSLGYADTAKKTACINGYAILVKDDSLVNVYSYANPISGYTGQGYQDPHCDEYLLEWEFVFDGTRLFMTSHSVAD